MPSLLTIPREIRDNIIELVLCSKRNPPPDIATAARSRRERHRRGIPERRGFNTWSYGPSHVEFEQRDCAVDSLPLLLVNRRLSCETKSAIERLALYSNLACSLDVMFVEERELWPTWLYLPVLAQQVDCIEVTFRVFGTAGEWKSAFQAGDASPPEILWCFYYLLELLLRRGPLGQRTSHVDKQLSIKTLVLNFSAEGDTYLLPPSNVEFGEWMQSRRQRSGTDFGVDLKETIMRPEWLADYIIVYLGFLLSMGYHTAVYGAVLYERIGRIRITVDGTLKREMDLGAILSALSFNGPSETFGHVWPREQRVPMFWRWKKDVLTKRGELGFGDTY
ncbi:MAG: hypothetical protein M1819_001638 [Sarea resinae]|nr:MAG: hypothetical protein M1819_001638 [Sarea resinae]